MNWRNWNQWSNRRSMSLTTISHTNKMGVEILVQIIHWIFLPWKSKHQLVMAK